MNTSKIALYTNPDEVLTLTPSESIISMFEHTDENGTLYIPEWPYDGNCKFQPLSTTCTEKQLHFHGDSAPLSRA